MGPPGEETPRGRSLYCPAFPPGESFQAAAGRGPRGSLSPESGDRVEAHGAKSPGKEGAAPREGSETASLLPPLRTDKARVMLFTKADTRRVGTREDA